MNQGKASMSGRTNQPGPSADQATKTIQGPAVAGARNGNATKGGGINRATAGQK